MYEIESKMKNKKVLQSTAIILASRYLQYKVIWAMSKQISRTQFHCMISKLSVILDKIINTNTEIIHTAEPLVLDPSPFELEIVTEKLKRYKSPGYPFYRRLGGPQSRYGEVNISDPTGTRTPAPLVVQPVASRYTD
jgi:hypothetical protein